MTRYDRDIDMGYLVIDMGSSISIWSSTITIWSSWISIAMWDIDMGDDSMDTVILDIDMGYLVTLIWMG